MRPWCFLVLNGCLLACGCAQNAVEETAMPPPKVTVATLTDQEVTSHVDFTGRAAAVETVKIRARVWGHLEKIKFTEGAEVKKDDLLFIIDRRPYKAALERANAEVGQSEARAKRIETDFNRARNLLMSRSISREEFDKVTGDLSEAMAAVRSAQAAQAVAKLNLDYTEVRSPIDGRISRAMVTEGNLVESGELGGTMLTTVVSLNPIYVYFDVDDLTFLRIGTVLNGNGKGGPPVMVGLPGGTGYPLKGTLDFVDNQIDPGTATMKMRGVFKNDDRLLTPGLFVRVRLPLGDPHRALLINDKAIETDQGQKIVYVVGKDNVVERRAVKLGGLFDGMREIVEGVRAGERLVVDGLQRVRQGVTVTPK